MTTRSGQAAGGREKAGAKPDGLDWAAKMHFCRSNRCHLPLLDGWSSAQRTPRTPPSGTSGTSGTAGTSKPTTGALIESGDWAQKTTLMQLNHQHTPAHQLAAGKTTNKLRETRCRILARLCRNRGKPGNHHTDAPLTIDSVRGMEPRGTCSCSPAARSAFASGCRFRKKDPHARRCNSHHASDRYTR